MNVSEDDFRAAYERNGRNARATADELGVPVTTLKSWPAYKAVRSPFVVVGRSTLKDADGAVKLVWEKESLDRQAEEEARQAAFEALSATLPRMPATAGPAAANAQLATVYTLTDAHVGMLAWRREGGEDWDLSIAERELVGCFAQMVHSAPDSEVGIVNQLGDFLHFDGLEAVTPTSRHVLDSDGRFGKVVETAIRVLRRVVDMALAKHSTVHVIMAEGNHDLASSVWLRKMFKALYENEPRVTVDDTELPFYAFEHGSTMLCFHHGHLKKNDQLPLMFATQFAAMWGRTAKRYCHTGHRHHLEEKEHSGMIVLQHPTLAARDAYAARGGYNSLRSATAVTYHRQYGEVGRVSATPEMLAA